MAVSTGSLNQNLTLLGILLIIVSVGGSYQFLILPTKTSLGELASLTAKEKGLSQDIADLKKVDQDLIQGKQTLAGQGTTLTTLQSIVPATEDMPGLYLQMEQLIKDPLIQKGTYQLGAPSADPAGGVKIPVTLTAQGSYLSLKRFIVNLEQNIRPISFTNIAFTIAGQDASASTTTVSAPAGSVSLSLTGYVTAQALSSAYSATP